MPWDWLRTNEPAQYSGNMLSNSRDVVPSLVNQVNSSMYPTGWNALQATRQLSPGFQGLMNNMFSQFAPGLNQTGSQINRSNTMGQMETQRDSINGPGGQYMQGVNNAVRSANPEFFQGLTQTGDSLTKLLGSIDLSGKLSGGEQTQISRGLNQEGQQRGDLNAPNQSSTVANAMQYGQASRNRQVQSQGILSDAISKATQFLSQANPTNSTGINAGTVTANTNGSTTMPNQGANNFMGLYQPSNQTGQNVLDSFLGGYNANSNTALNNWSQMNMNQQNINANKKDWMDMVSQMSPVGKMS